MKISDAAAILGLSGHITPDATKSAYRAAARRYHPDRNPAGAEMMKLVNAAFDALKSFTGTIPKSDQTDPNYPDAVNEALRAIVSLGLEVEICGAWVWVGGNTFPHRRTLKAAGFIFASKKRRWYFRPENWRSSSRGSFTMDEIRHKYGSRRPRQPHIDLLQKEEARV